MRRLMLAAAIVLAASGLRAEDMGCALAPQYGSDVWVGSCTGNPCRYAAVVREGAIYIGAGCAAIGAPPPAPPAPTIYYSGGLDSQGVPQCWTDFAQPLGPCPAGAALARWIWAESVADQFIDWGHIGYINDYHCGGPQTRRVYSWTTHAFTPNCKCVATGLSLPCPSGGTKK